MPSAPSSSPKATHHARLIIHGGAGAITRSNLPPASYSAYTSALLSVNRSTSLLLSRGTPALDAATNAVTHLENNPLFNCGKGAVFTRSGTIELEASVMVSRGYRKRGCAVSLVKRVKSPVALAREMLVRGDLGDGGGGGNGGGDGDPAGGSGGAQGHCHLSGVVVEGLAAEWGLEIVEERYFWTRKRWEEHKRGLGGVEDWGEKVGTGGVGQEWEGEDDGGWDGREYLPQGTVGCVVLDQYGTLCVATSTGGLTNKLAGRIGDTPTLGAGFWAEEWIVPSPAIYKQPFVRSPLITLLPGALRQGLTDCIPGLAGYVGLSQYTDADEKLPSTSIRAVAMSGTGNGDSFLRLAAVRTAAAISRFSPNRSLASAVCQIAGPGGELEQSAGDRWGRTGEGEGGIIGIEMVDGKGRVVFDFNCGGMFRTWVDDDGKERMMVFKEPY
ncbi:hypothetical protein MMC24_002024 [Lignoscripta atroalba]|nr:hypothetical protein [Lignoscripta atroalba]